ncbi:Asp23/Gls24 family envelope stress response protein [Herbiconiux ginsengi]|uniref:Asp23 family, cell envelope-related function n=1 Tax=Herbiconiux ginsengi TaxID=381665 RepID=A0A1H3KKN5_9MICO|nr:Asp23/Gls24 family envelope stress response protein [Herbiconiux ginsengi]SDY52731.1 Asp23 family, cell envelope-related function [Herbiconiux ginsengi]
MANTAAAPLVVSSTETTHGKTVITENVVSTIAGIAARDVKGVHALGGGAARMLGAIIVVDDVYILSIDDGSDHEGQARVK